jgi:hypothetical protein
MFFRREKPRIPSFEERLRDLEKLGVRSAKKSADTAVAVRGRCAAAIRKVADNDYRIDPAGIAIGNEIGELTDAGNQKFWLTPSGKKEAATAEQLKELHAFQEDLREGLGLPSLYNEGLGTVNSLHIYDRVKGRDQGAALRPWERAKAS